MKIYDPPPIEAPWHEPDCLSDVARLDLSGKSLYQFYGIYRRAKLSRAICKVSCMLEPMPDACIDWIASADQDLAANSNAPRRNGSSIGETLIPTVSLSPSDAPMIRTAGSTKPPSARHIAIASKQ